jgi:TolB-like protein/predicted Zn-dependent protease
VLVLAWYHGDRGQQRISTSEFAILTLLLLLGGGAFRYYQRANETAKDAAPTANAAQPPASAAVSDARPSVAVLPFENRSREADDAFFVDGIHDDILTQLAKIGAMRVIARTSVEPFRDTKLTTREIAEKLGVSKLLEGGVQRAGDRVRVTVQLIDAANDAHVWAENYDRELTAANIFAIQSEVATAIAAALNTALSPAEQSRVATVPTQSLEAWEAYQLGKQRMAKRTSSALADAEQFVRKAIALDPHFALAWVGLADALALQAHYGTRPKETGLRHAEEAVTRALKLDPNSAEAWATAGSIAADRFQLQEAEQMFRRAIALNPNYAPSHHWLSMALKDLGRQHEGLAEAERAAALDPLSAVINLNLGSAQMYVGRFDDALGRFARAIEIDPAMATPYLFVGDAHTYGFGRLDRAIPCYEIAVSLDPGAPDLLASLAEAYWELGNDREAERWLARMVALGEGSVYTHFVAALLYLELGNTDPALTHAQKAADLDPGWMFPVRDYDLRRGDYAAARARYAKSFPHLFTKDLPRFTNRDAFAAIDLAFVLQQTSEKDQAKALLDRSEAYLRTMPRLGFYGYGISDVAIHVIRGETAVALAKLREAERAGWRRWWPYHRDFDPTLASIRNEPEFKAVFADIERDMAKQRAALAARPKDAPLDLAATGT